MQATAACARDSGLSHARQKRMARCLSPEGVTGVHPSRASHGHAMQAPSDLYLALQLAHDLSRAGEVAQAVERYRQVAHALVQHGELEQGVQVYLLLAQMMPHCLHTRGMLADLYRRQGRVVEAADLYELIAQDHLEAGRLVEAMHVYRLLVQVDPATVPRRVQLAELFSRLGMSEAAVTEFDVAARQLLAGNRSAEFLWVASRLLAHQGDHVATLREVVRVCLELGDVPNAVLYLRHLLGVSRRDDIGRELMADAFAARGRLDMACQTVVLLAREFVGRGPHFYDEAKRLLLRGVQWYPYAKEAQRELAGVEGLLAARQRGIVADVSHTGTIERRPRSSEDDGEDDTTTIMFKDDDDPQSGRVIYAQFG